MLDIGWSELMVIGIVALVVIGPKELPGVLRSVGAMIGKLRRMAGEFQGQFQEALREAELSDLKKDLTGFGEDARNSISGAMPSNPLLDIENEMKAVTAPVERSDMPAADPVVAQLSEPSELEPNAFESVEDEVRVAAAKLDVVEPDMAVSEPAKPKRKSRAKPADADPALIEPEVSEAVAALDDPTPAEPARPKRASRAKAAPVEPVEVEPEISEAVAALDETAPPKPKRKPRSKAASAPSDDEGSDT